MPLLSFRVPAITCRDCVRKISARVSDVPGVRTVEVDIAAGIVRVTGEADSAAVRAAIADAGYQVTAPDDPPRSEGDPR